VDLLPGLPAHLDNGWSGSWGGHSQLAMLYLPDFLCESGSGCGAPRSDSPTGVAEVFALDAPDQPLPSCSGFAPIHAPSRGTAAAPALFRPQSIASDTWRSGFH
jgi:hypothetical protein